MRTTYLLVLICFSLLLIACGEDKWDFLKDAGKTVTVEREVDAFNEIKLVDRVDIQDTIEKFILTGPENLLAKVSTSIKNGSLKIVDNNSYNWYRGFNFTITATIHIKEINRIYYEGIGNITTENQLVTDTLYVESIKSSGNINLNIDVDYFHCFFNHSMVDFNAVGNALGAHLQINGTGFLRCENLITSSCFVHNQGSGDIIANSAGYLAGIIEGLGNVLYTGNPHETVFEYKGRGSGSFIEF